MEGIGQTHQKEQKFNSLHLGSLVTPFLRGDGKFQRKMNLERVCGHPSSRALQVMGLWKWRISQSKGGSPERFSALCQETSIRLAGYPPKLGNSIMSLAAIGDLAKNTK
jgi:hypothetical protein